MIRDSTADMLDLFRISALHPEASLWSTEVRRVPSLVAQNPSSCSQSMTVTTGRREGCMISFLGRAGWALGTERKLCMCVVI